MRDIHQLHVALVVQKFHRLFLPLFFVDLRQLGWAVDNKVRYQGQEAVARLAVTVEFVFDLFRPSFNFLMPTRARTSGSTRFSVELGVRVLINFNYRWVLASRTVISRSPFISTSRCGSSVVPKKLESNVTESKCSSQSSFNIPKGKKLLVFPSPRLTGTKSSL